ncbi:MAG: hypothetical protein QXU98_14075 [Candidatus Parvarchaeota archaeon]
MKPITTVSIVYFSSSVASSLFYPPLFIPLTISYVLGVAEYEVLDYIDRRWLVR